MVEPTENPIKLNSEELNSLASSIPDWNVEQLAGMPRLVRTFEFADFASALSFTNKVGRAADAADHHPQITLTWGSARVEWWTHSVGGITENDVDMAKTTDTLFNLS